MTARSRSATSVRQTWIRCRRWPASRSPFPGRRTGWVGRTGLAAFTSTTARSSTATSRTGNDKGGWESVWPDGYIIIQSLATYNKEYLPSSIKMPKWVQRFATYNINHSKSCQNQILLKFCQSGKFLANQDTLVRTDHLKKTFFARNVDDLTSMNEFKEDSITLWQCSCWIE